VNDDATAARATWRAEEEQWTRAAFERWEHGRGLDDVLRDCMQRGDRVSVVFATVTWSGDVVAVGDDVARIVVDGVPIDVRLDRDAPFVVRVSTESSHVARQAARLTTFVARLRELDGTAVCIGTPTATLEGELRLGRDQVRVVDRDGGAAYVPIGSICWARPVDD
jgi:hypothetical protein